MPKPTKKILGPRGRVFKAMGIAGKGNLAGQSRRDVQRHFEPHAGRRYPTSRTSDASRVPIEFGARQWGHIDFMRRALKSPALAREIARDPIARMEFERALFDAVQERALKAYAEEWSALSPKAISTLIGRTKAVGAKPTPTIANERNAAMVAREAIQKLRKGQEVTIVDLGTGGGGTIVPAIDAIPRELRHKLRVVLIDVMHRGLASTKKKLVGRGLGGKEQIITIRENISKLTASNKLAQLFGTADIVTSGAALHHVAAIEPTFEGVKRLLKKGGAFIFWDWGHAAWKAPRLVVAPEGAIVDKYGRAYEKGARTRHAGTGTAFVSRNRVAGVTQGKAPTELQAVREMLSTWVSLLHFPAKRRAEFLQWFDERVAKGAPINFSEFLRRLEGTRLQRGMLRAEIKYWEGHRPPELYHDAMKAVGLLEERTKPFTIYPTANPLLYQMKIRKG